MAPNPLISTQQSSDGLQVALHPLALLTVSDYITRHTLRDQKQPIVGALLGQQNGREITIEHAFDVLLISVNDEVQLHKAWFEERLQQMKDVHKVPALDLVGWYTLMPISGPQPSHLSLHRDILDSYNESAILLGFHPTSVLESSVGSKLPLTIYESNWEAEVTNVETGEDKEMKDANEPQMSLKFKELPYSIETGEAEMISVDFVARGGGNATAVEKPKADDSKPAGGKKASKQKADAVKTEDQNVLSREDEEKIASLTAKLNAIKMLKSRLDLIIAYLQQLPPEGSPAAESTQYTEPNHQIFRSIQALLQRLTLLVPANSAAFSQEILSEQNDVALVSLLSTMTASVQDIREMGKKYKVIEDARYLKMNKGGNNWDGGHGAILGGVGDLMS